MTTMVHEYGLLQPMDGEDLVGEQIWLAHQYYNKLVEIERARRRTVLEAQESVGDISEASKRYRVSDDAVKALATQERLSRSGAGTVAAPSAESVAAAKGAREEAKAALREAKAGARELLTFLYKAAEEKAHEERLAARAVCKCYWGTYLVVEQAFDLARKATPGPDRPFDKFPSFRQWTGAGAVAVQVQNGLRAEELFGEDPRIRISPLPDQAFDVSVPRGQRNRLQRTTLRLRVASDGRDPVWASWPLYMHRPLPEGALVKWAKVIRTPWHQRWQYRWRLQITIEVPTPQRANNGGMVAVNLGWRLMEDGELRVATWADTAGETGEVRLGQSFRERIWKAESIRSVRDKEVNALRKSLVDAGVDCAQWRSPGRFHRLRKAGGLSEDVLMLLSEWSYRDNHLWWYERGCRSGALGYRREVYRLLALDLARRYPIIVVESYDLRPLVTDKSRVQEPSAQRVEVAPSEARLALRSTASRLGCLVVEGQSKLATQRCHLCGCEELWDASPAVMHTCPRCGKTWDQDVNNARNMLASAVKAMKTRDPLAGRKPQRAARFAKRHKKEASG